jgi:hypothetical protein
LGDFIYPVISALISLSTAQIEPKTRLLQRSRVF